MRLKAIIKRTSVSDIWRWDDIEVDLDSNRITRDGKDINLTLKERQILLLLIDANGGVVQRATIVDELRGGDAIWNDTNDAKIDVYLSNLRKKLHKTMIHTVKGV